MQKLSPNGLFVFGVIFVSVKFNNHNWFPVRIVQIVAISENWPYKYINTDLGHQKEGENERQPSCA